MTGALVFLPIFPWPLPDEHMETLKQAKAALDLPFKILPVEGVPGSSNRVLSFGGVPDFFCSYAPIREENAGSVPSVAAALHFALQENEGWSPDPRWDEAAWLSQAMGCDVTFSHIEQEDGKVVFHVDA